MFFCLSRGAVYNKHIQKEDTLSLSLSFSKGGPPIWENCSVRKTQNSPICSLNLFLMNCGEKLGKNRDLHKSSLALITCLNSHRKTRSEPQRKGKKHECKPQNRCIFSRIRGGSL